MVVLPAGKIAMGLKPGGDGRGRLTDARTDMLPQVVDIPKPFAIATHDVTRQEYAEFAQATGRVSEEGCYYWRIDNWVEDGKRSWRSPGFKQSPSDPVVCVNWEDAQAYVRWLNDRSPQVTSNGGTRLAYRLPTWAELQYAAGAQNESRFYWGENPDHRFANYGSGLCPPCGGTAKDKDRWRYTSPVGSFPANPFGLFDVVGNVWQWTSSCFPIRPNCTEKVIYGGSWRTDSRYLETQAFAHNDGLNRDTEIGFRIVRDLTSEQALQ